MTRLVYVGGYGRSGSTLLEYLLTASADVVACGEVVLAAKRKDIPRCSCGQTRETCGFWNRLLTPERPPGSWTHEDLMLALLDDCRDRFAVVVDSSKTARGSFLTPFAFRRRLGDDFQLIHLVREPHGVCWSRRSGKRLSDVENSPRRFVRYVRTMAGWLAANMACEAFGRRYPDQYTKVRYEDLAGAPEETVGAIFEKLQLGPAPRLDNLNATGNRHQLFGNRVRLHAPVPSEIRHDARWQREMAAPDRMLISALSWPLRWRYGY